MMLVFAWKDPLVISNSTGLEDDRIFRKLEHIEISEREDDDSDDAVDNVVGATILVQVINPKIKVIGRDEDGVRLHVIVSLY